MHNFNNILLDKLDLLNNKANLSNSTNTIPYDYPFPNRRIVLTRCA